MLELIIALFCFFIGYQAGKWSAIINIAANAVLEENKKIEQESERYLTIEKITNVYYAYLDKQFLGQSDNKKELVTIIGKHAKSFRLMTDFYTAPDGDQDYDQERQEIIDLLVKELGN